MKSSSAQTLGIVLAVLAVLMVIGFFRFLIAVPLGIVDGVGHGWSHRAGTWFWPFAGFAGFFGLAFLVIWVMVALWVHRDAESRGMEGVIWALVVFFVHVIGLIIYLIVRSNHPVLTAAPASKPQTATPPPQAGETAAPSIQPAPVCKSCGRPVEKDHVYCAMCGQNLHPACSKCGKEIQKDWQVCPFCGEKI
ncbi:MAG: zinc ribbon domain-containing protein [Candidatus Aminicenantales bacterium]